MDILPTQALLLLASYLDTNELVQLRLLCRGLCGLLTVNADLFDVALLRDGVRGTVKHNPLSGVRSGAWSLFTGDGLETMTPEAVARACVAIKRAEPSEGPDYLSVVNLEQLRAVVDVLPGYSVHVGMELDPLAEGFYMMEGTLDSIKLEGMYRCCERLFEARITGTRRRERVFDEGFIPWIIQRNHPEHED